MIGAVTISELAKVLEYSARDNRIDIINRMHTVYIEELNNLVERLQNVYSSLEKNDKEQTNDLNFKVITNKKSVLVVDDSSSMLSAIKGLLKDKYKVTIVTSGSQAIRFLEKKRPDIILLDYLMPEMDGIMTLKEIRQMSQCVDIPILFLTGADDNSINNLSELDVSGVVKKPPVLEDLLEKIENNIKE